MVDCVTNETEIVVFDVHLGPMCRLWCAAVHVFASWLWKCFEVDSMSRRPLGLKCN